MTSEANRVTLTEQHYNWIADAFNYGASSSFGAATNRLTLFRQHIYLGGFVFIRPDTENITLNSVIEFDKWVHTRFPFLVDMPEYPRERTFGKLSDFINGREYEILAKLGNSSTLGSIRTEGLSSANIFLQAMALINISDNHRPNYGLNRIDNVGSLYDDIVHYFTKGKPSNHRDWNIITEQYNGEWEEIVSITAEEWFFKQEASPNIDTNATQIIIETLLTYLRSVTNAHIAYTLKVTPPIFYDIFWQDIILEDHNQRWLLHFGFSD